ncbi:FAD-dependent oxidoreductase [Lacisediminimonas sp.]|uniref:FAD-dependent oxidoreductase n=1 Tax=Lacisediminimonas sp. TaxID=3060582 RepID=UPI002720258B|nr:FAD-dependent oxidoreductase [Lacisediminimonas sp.]MDO8300676.1 FAD-dependent oxidoreductase [Lacisediminimonas sp.]
MKQLVLVGAGHAHAQVLRVLASRPLDDTRVVLVSPYALAPYSGMVPGWLAGHYDWNDCCIDFQRLCQRAGATFLLDSVSALDTHRSQLFLSSGAPLDYNWLSLNHGATLHVPQSDRIMVLPMRPLAQLHERWNRLLGTVQALPPGSSWRVLMIGGGAAGVESILAARHQLTVLAPAVKFEFSLATQGSQLMSGHSAMAASIMRKHLARAGIRVHYEFKFAALDGDQVTSTSGAAIATDAVLWATGAQAHEWPGRSGLSVDRNGFIRVDDMLRARSHPHVFAAGDCASWEPALPKAGVVAVRMGPILADNILASVRGRHLTRYLPQRRHLALIGSGGHHAVASWGALGWQGNWVWNWKERIDRNFVAKYNET